MGLTVIAGLYSPSLSTSLAIWMNSRFVGLIPIKLISLSSSCVFTSPFPSSSNISKTPLYSVICSCVNLLAWKHMKELFREVQYLILAVSGIDQEEFRTEQQHFWIFFMLNLTMLIKYIRINNFAYEVGSLFMRFSPFFLLVQTRLRTSTVTTVTVEWEDVLASSSLHF